MLLSSCLRSLMFIDCLLSTKQCSEVFPQDWFRMMRFDIDYPNLSGLRRPEIQTYKELYKWVKGLVITNHLSNKVESNKVIRFIKPEPPYVILDTKNGNYIISGDQYFIDRGNNIDYISHSRETEDFDHLIYGSPKTSLTHSDKERVIVELLSGGYLLLEKEEIDKSTLEIMQRKGLVLRILQDPSPYVSQSQD